MSTWIDRLQTEHDELMAKLYILAPLVAGTRPEAINVQQWAMMKQQVLYMSLYLEVLKDRLNHAAGLPR